MERTTEACAREHLLVADPHARNAPASPERPRLLLAERPSGSSRLGGPRHLEGGHDLPGTHRHRGELADQSVLVAPEEPELKGRDAAGSDGVELPTGGRELAREEFRQLGRR